ncbi:MAG: 50S ribosomal protein L33 [Elusimicrobia bacterium]|nr:50S ribosomal protein L33 [Candidatus Obscuribacterium magneticum]
MASGGGRNVVALKCVETGDINYYFNLGRKKKPERAKVEVKKYCPRCHRHTVHKETKP